jgi:hypothetical protein
VGLEWWLIVELALPLSPMKGGEPADGEEAARRDTRNNEFVVSGAGNDEADRLADREANGTAGMHDSVAARLADAVTERQIRWRSGGPLRRRLELRIRRWSRSSIQWHLKPLNYSHLDVANEGHREPPNAWQPEVANRRPLAEPTGSARELLKGMVLAALIVRFQDAPKFVDLPIGSRPHLLLPATR